MSIKTTFTNNTLEEQLRELICDQQKELNDLRQNIIQLKNMVAEESEAKYRAYVRIADLRKHKEVAR